MDLSQTKEELLKQSVKLLKRKSKTLKLSPQGNKSEIIDRIIAAYNDNSNQDESSELMNQNNTSQVREESSKEKKALLSARLNYQYKCKISKRKSLVKYLRKSKSELLFYGYLRSLQNRKNIYIPQDVIMLFISFYYLSLPPYKLSSNNLCYIDTDNQILTTRHCNRGSGRQYTYIIFNTPWKGDKHELRIQCVKGNKKEIGIGVITNKNANDAIHNARSWLFLDCDAGLTYHIYSSGKWKNKDPTKIYCYDFGDRRYRKAINKYICDGMIISIKLDLWERRIQFYLDNQIIDELSIGVGIYYPTITYRCDRMQPFDLQYRLLLCD